MEDLHRRLFSVLMDHESKHGMAGWRPRGLGRWINLPRQRFPSREASSFGEAFTAFVFGHAHIHSSIDVPTGSALCRHV
jgi:hypothetical protein